MTNFRVLFKAIGGVGGGGGAAGSKILISLLDGQKSNMAAIFWQFSSHQMAQNQNFQNRYINFVELHTENLQIKFQVPSI